MIDLVTIELHGGDGGRGAVSFHREKFVPQGGPDGGNGGRGGHISMVANAQLNTLNRYRRQHIFRADGGNPGRTNNRSGRDGDDLILEVPVGTIATRLGDESEPEEQLGDLHSAGMGILLARAGRGGRGNTFFKSSTNRTPRVAQRGQPGVRLTVRLELRLIADIGLVGLPNAGKSTLLRQLSAARPRVAAYPFTTLEPYLGVVSVGWDEFVIADLPGLIEGAADGAGLGHDFLRHTSRTRLLIHVIDGGEADPVASFDAINAELAAYDGELRAKPQLVVVNKLDLEQVQARREELTAAFAARGTEVTFISAAAGDGTGALAERCMRDLHELRLQEPPAPVAQEPPVVHLKIDARRFSVAREASGGYRVIGQQAETFLEMMDMDDPAAVDEVYRWLERRGISAALRRAGLQPGDSLRIGDAKWAWEA